MKTARTHIGMTMVLLILLSVLGGCGIGQPPATDPITQATTVATDTATDVTTAAGTTVTTKPPYSLDRVIFSVKEAYFDEASTLDYNGIYMGKYIEFDAKETQSKTSFPLANIHAHQLEHIRKVLYFKGIAFLIVRFVNLDKTE